MAEPYQYVNEFRDELNEQFQPENLPQLVVPALITGLAVAVARRWL